MKHKHFSFKNVECSTGEHFSSYEEYLQTQHWKNIRQKIYTLNNGTCQRCKKKCKYWECNVHHKSYARLGHEENKDLQLLCFDCHEKVHKIKEKKEKEQKRINEICKIINEKEKPRFYAGKFYNSKEAKKISPVVVYKET